MEACLNRGWEPILPGCGGTRGGVPRGAISAARAPPYDWPRQGWEAGVGGGTLGQWDWGSENAGMKAITHMPTWYCITRAPLRGRRAARATHWHALRMCRANCPVLCSMLVGGVTF